MSIEATKQALEALEKYCDQAAIDNMRQVIEQAEKKKPVAWMYVNVDGECEQIEYGACDYDDPSITFLYTAPPRKPWVGLTSEEVVACWARPDLFAIAHAIESKLKEKNT